jgi:MFS family permease
LLPVGALAFLFMGPGASPVMAGFGSTVMGLGMGFLSTSAIVIIQDSVGWAERGSATASNIFSRNLGSTLGATMLGAILNISLAHRGTGATTVHFDQIRQLLDHAGRGIGDGAVREALGQSLHLTFWAVFLIAVSTLALATFVPSVTVKPGRRPVAAE